MKIIAIRESELQNQEGRFSKSRSINHISPSDESSTKLNTGGLRYQTGDSEAERKNQPPKEREKLVLV